MAFLARLRGTTNSRLLVGTHNVRMSWPHATFAGAVAGVVVLFSLYSWLSRMDVRSVPVEETRFVAGSELGIDNTRPSWENNLNWWIDGNDATRGLPDQPSLAEMPATLPGAPAPQPNGSTRTMWVAAAQAGTTPLADNHTDGPTIRDADSKALRVLSAFVTGAVLIVASLLRLSSVSVRQSTPRRRSLLTGLERWLADRDASRELEPKSRIVYGGAALGTATRDAPDIVVTDDDRHNDVVRPRPRSDSDRGPTLTAVDRPKSSPCISFEKEVFA